MTKVRFYRDLKGLRGFEITGHSGYAREGEDILCAALSAMTQLVVNTLTEQFSIEADIKTDEKKACVSLIISGAACNGAARAVLNGFKKELEQLSLDYPKNLAVNEESVF